MMVTKDNYKVTAAKLYRNPVFSDEEFIEDLNLIKYVVTKIEKYSINGKFSTKLNFNKFVVACNCFGAEFVVKSLYLLVNPIYQEMIMTFLYTMTNYDSSLRINKELVVVFDVTKINQVFKNKLTEEMN